MITQANCWNKNITLLYCSTNTICKQETFYCDQCNYSSRFIYFYPRIKHELDRMNRSKDMAIQNYTRRQTAAILDLVQPEIAPFDPPTSKTLP